MTIYNEDYEYAAEKITETVVRKANGIPVYVHKVWVRDKQVQVSPLNKMGERSLVKLKELNLSSPPLGFVNLRGRAVFVSRIPKRRDWKQGLRGTNIAINNFNIDFIDLFRNGSLTNTIMGKYPKFDSCIKTLSRPNTKARSLAWCRHWALYGRELIAEYKDWGGVGVINAKDKTITFHDKFSFLRESFEESLV